MKKIPESVKTIIKTLEENGYEAYIVGGCVRDMLLGKEPSDFDITTNAFPQNVKELFEKTVDTGIKHGTVSVILNGTPYEVTTYRTESGYDDMRHPSKIEFVANIEDDLSRRDFTVNAMAYNEKTGLVDCFGGKEDIKKRLLRAVGNPDKRFSEDALRIMRLFRFSSTLGFEPEKKTERSAVKLSKNLKNVSSERIWSELEKLLCGSDPDAIRPVINKGGLESFGIFGNKSLKKIALLSSKPEIRFFAFVKILDLDVLTVIQKLKIKNSIKNYCQKCEQILFIDKNSDDISLKTALETAGVTELFDVIEYKEKVGNINMSGVRARAERILKAAEPYKISQLKIKGGDLKDLGYNDEEIGEMLSTLLSNVKEFPDNNKKEILKNIANKRNSKR